MVHILLNTFRFSEPWYQPTIGRKTIQNILRTHRRPVFALKPNGALVVDQDGIHSIGDTVCFLPHQEI